MNTRLGRKQSHDGQGRNALAGAGFANQREGFTGLKSKRNFVYRRDRTLRGGELYGEIVKL